jgi:hypothetical protein
MGEAAQQIPNIVGISVVVGEAVQQPFLGVVGSDLDRIHDGLGLQESHLLLGRGLGEGKGGWDTTSAGS